MIMDCISSNSLFFLFNLPWTSSFSEKRFTKSVPLVSLMIGYIWEEVNKKQVSEKYIISKTILILHDCTHKPFFFKDTNSFMQNEYVVKGE